MGTIGIVLLVFFVIVCLLLVLLVSIQDDGENGMGGLIGGRGTAAFGSQTGNVLTKTTFVLVVLFFAFALGLALVNKAPKIEKDLMSSSAVEAEADTTATTSADWWVTEEAAE